MAAARLVFAAAVSGGALGAGATLLLLRRRQQAVLTPEAAELEDLASHPALKYGMPVSDRLRAFDNYVALFDTRLRNPKWVIEHITATKLQGDGRRQTSAFYEDPGIEDRFRSRLTDYRGSGFDRGHLAPAANHKASQAAMDATFCLSNTSPQVGDGFNRDYWARFERFVQSTVGGCSDVWIVSGPLYLPTKGADGSWVLQHGMLGTPPRLMAVPTHFFKVVLGELTPGSKGGATAAVGAFVMPNAPVDPATPLTAFAVPLSALEEAAGLKFFPGHLNEERRLALDKAALEWQALGRLERQEALPAPTARLLLGAPAGSSASSGTGAPQPAAAGSAAVATFRAPGAVAPRHGVLHLCDHTECRLPAERWWETTKGRREAAGKKRK